MSTILAKSKINNTTVKLTQLKRGFKVSYSGFCREFSSIEKAAKAYAETVSLFVTMDSQAVVDAFNRPSAIAEQLKDL